MDNDSIVNMLSKIVDGDNTGAKEDFESIISQKLNLALDAKKQEVAQSIYGQTVTTDNDSHEGEEEDEEGEEHDAETSSEQESEDAVQ